MYRTSFGLTRTLSFIPSSFSSTVWGTFFFFHAEDGIRDFHVTGVQTCALPISAPAQEEQTPEPQYGGPAILSRGGTSTLRVPTESIRIRPFLTVNGNYDTGITPVTVSTQGKIPNDNSLGVEVEAGLYGYH